MKSAARIVTARKPKSLKGVLGIDREKPPEDPESERRANEWMAGQMEKHRQMYLWGLTRPKE
jgi:hypothetical protein